MSRTPNFDARIKAILDATKPGERVCRLTGEKWMMTEEEIGWYRKFNVSPSGRSPLARMRILSGFMNGFQWWWNRHAETSHPILSFAHPSSGWRVLPDQEWYARDFSSMFLDANLGRSFFEQLRTLKEGIPLKATNNVVEPEHSMALGSKGDIDSYFVADGAKNRSCFFTLFSAMSEHSAEVHNVLQATDSFHVNDAFNVFHSQYASDLRGLSHSAFAFIASDCSDCFGVANRRHKRHLFFNEPLMEKDYEERRGAIDLGKRSVTEEWKKKFQTFLSEEIVWPENMNWNTEGSIGEYLVGARDARFCFSCVEKPVRLFHVAFTAREVRDSAFLVGASETADSYQCAFAEQCSSCLFSYSLIRCRNLEYCFECQGCENCFGCVGLQQKKFHLFNRPYAEEEYWKRVDEMRCAMLDQGEYGEFFPLDFSPVYFLQSASALYWLSGREEARQLGASLYDPSSADAIGEGRVESSLVRSSSEIPDSIDEITDDWCGIPIRDEVLNRCFTFLKSEVALYRELRVAPPNRHFIRRMTEMIQEANSAVFTSSSCDKCGKEISLSKNVTFPKRTVFCTDCFNRYFESVS